MAENPKNTISTIDHVPAGEHGKGFPPFEKDTFASQLIWFAIFFIALYVIIARLAIPRLGGIVDARRARIEGDFAEANRLKEQSDAALKAYEKSLADARGRAQALANETRDKLNAEAEKARKVLEGKLNAKLAEAEKTIAATKTAAMANVRGIAVDTAAAIVQRLIGTAPAGGAVEAAVTDALKR
jgi:F-type H+-transporting ATPase subunit b